MDNIGDILNGLSDDDIQRLQEMAGELFGGDAQTNSEDKSRASDNPFSAINPDVITKLSSLMNMMNKSDSRCELIEALKPNLSISRQKRADEAMQLIKLFDILPLLEKLK